jgi:integrase
MTVWKRYKRYYYTYFYIRLKGKRQRIIQKVTGGITNREHAQLFEDALKIRLMKGEVGLHEKDLPLGQLVSDYLQFSKNNKAPATYRRDELALRTFLRVSGVRNLSDLTSAAMESYKDRRQSGGGKVKKVSKRTVNLEVTMVKAMLNWAVERRMIPKNPILYVKKIRGPESKTIEFLTREEMQALLQAATPTYHPIFYTYLKTGIRKAELIHLEWSDIDFTNKQIRVVNKEDHPTKTYKDRHVPIDDKLVAVLGAIPRGKNRYVFVTKEGTIRENNLFRELQRTAKKAKIRKHVTVHMLRHTYASHLVMNGMDIRSVQELLGHSNIKTTQRYAHLAPDHLKEAAKKLSFI